MLTNIMNIEFHTETTNNPYKVCATINDYSVVYKQLKQDIILFDDNKSRWLSAILKNNYEGSYKDFVQEMVGDPIRVCLIAYESFGNRKNFGYVKIQYSPSMDKYTIGSKKSYIDITKYVGTGYAEYMEFRRIQNHMYDGYFAFFRNFDMEIDIIVERTDD